MRAEPEVDILPPSVEYLAMKTAPAGTRVYDVYVRPYDDDLLQFMQRMWVCPCPGRRRTVLTKSGLHTDDWPDMTLVGHRPHEHGGMTVRVFAGLATTPRSRAAYVYAPCLGSGQRGLDRGTLSIAEAYWQTRFTSADGWSALQAVHHLTVMGQQKKLRRPLINGSRTPMRVKTVTEDTPWPG